MSMIRQPAKYQISSLKDVAEQAGVSKSTASRILNDRKGNGFSVRAEVRRRVLATAKELNYHHYYSVAQKLIFFKSSL